MKKYTVILADPPWNYRDYGAPPGQTHDRARGAAKHYPTMTIDRLCQLEIPAADQAVLFMWCTWPLLIEPAAPVHRVIEAWGFKGKTLAWEWVKTTKDGSRPIMGMGHYTRSNVEPCILAFKGKPLKVADKSIINVIQAPRRRHSRKPEIQYTLIDQLYPAGERLEMFATDYRPGWDVWGNAVESEVEI